MRLENTLNGRRVRELCQRLMEEREMNGEIEKKVMEEERDNQGC